MASSELSCLSSAIENEDMQTLKSLLSNNPEILDLAAQNWPKNPLILACKLRNFRAVAEIGIWKPKFTGQKFRDGYTILHKACVRGDVEMVRALVRLDSQLCFLKDDSMMTPLQMAVKHGHGDAIRELLLSCPESFENLTSQEETVFHLAAKNYQSDAFEVLLDEAKKLNQRHLLHPRDRRGNTALHVAVSNQLIQVVKLLFFDRNLEAGLIQVNAKNNKGETALDLYYQIPSPGSATLEIGHLLREAGGREGYFLKRNQSSPNLRSAKNDLLVVLAIFIGLAVSITCSLPTLFPKEKFIASQVVFQYQDVASQGLPPVFYIMSLITVVFAMSIGFLAALLWSFPCRSLLFFAEVVTFLVYAVVTYFIVPKFFIRTGSHYVSSFYLMWVLAMGLILSDALLILVWKSLSSLSFDFVKWVKEMKLVSNVLSSSKIRLSCLKRSSRVQMVGIPSTSEASNN